MNYTVQFVQPVELVHVIHTAQRKRDKGSNPGKRKTQGSEDLQENVLLHHAGGCSAATSHPQGGHDGEL